MSQLNKLKKISDLKSAVQLAGADLLVVSQNNAIRKATIDLLAEKVASQVQDGKRIVFRLDSGYIQWQYAGAKTWTNLVALVDLQGPPGTSANSTVQFMGDGVRKIFSPVAGIINNEAKRCMVAVGGVVQTAIKSFTVNPVNNGTLEFDEAPPNGVDVTIQSYQ
jgi:hypothetical protein